MQDGGGGHKPTPDGAGGVARPGHPDHAALRQRHRHQGVGHRPDDRPPSPGPFLAGTGEFHRDRQVGRADPEQQVVRVGATSLPQAAARARGDAERRGGVGALLAPGGLFRVERGPGVALDPRPVIGVFGRLPAPVRLPAAAALAQRAADQQHRAQPGHRQHVHMVQQERQRQPDHQRQTRRQHRQRAPINRDRPARRQRHRPPPPAAAAAPTRHRRTRQRHRPRRPAEIQPAPVRRRAQHHIRRRVRRQPEQRAADGDLLPRQPRHGRPELRPVQRGGHARIRGDLTAALVVDVDQQRPRRHRRVADADRRRAAADVRPPGADPVDHPGVRPARHQNVHQARRRGNHAAVGAAEADHAAVPDRRLGQRQPPPYPLAIDVQRNTRRRAPRALTTPKALTTPTPPGRHRHQPDPVPAREPLKLARHRRHRGPRVGVNHDVRRSPDRGRDYRHQQPHKYPKARITGSDRPATLLHGCEARPVQ